MAKEKVNKRCTSCKKIHDSIKDYYISTSPIFSDGRVPICKNCIEKMCVNEDGTLSEENLQKTLRLIDKPYFKDVLQATIKKFAEKNKNLNDKAIKKFGSKFVSDYFRRIAMKQYVDKSYDDSENLGFVSMGSGVEMKKDTSLDTLFTKAVDEANAIEWSDKDMTNKNYVLSTIGYNPFEHVGLTEEDEKYCFNMLAGYCDTDGLVDDGHKMQGVIEITMLYCQVRKISEAMNEIFTSDKLDSVEIAKLTSAKTSLLSSIATIAKDNNISSNYNKNSKQGQSSLSLKMKEMSENNYKAIQVNLFDIKTSEAFRQIDDISNSNIANQITLDNNDYTEIVKEQREMITDFNRKIDELEEENRKLKNEVIFYKKQIDKDGDV